MDPQHGRIAEQLSQCHRSECLLPKWDRIREHDDPTSRSRCGLQSERQCASAQSPDVDLGTGRTKLLHLDADTDGHGSRYHRMFGWRFLLEHRMLLQRIRTERLELPHSDRKRHRLRIPGHLLVRRDDRHLLRGSRIHPHSPIGAAHRQRLSRHPDHRLSLLRRYRHHGEDPRDGERLMKTTQENRNHFGTPGESIRRDSVRGRSRKRIHMDRPVVRVWQLFNLEFSLTLAVLLLIAPHLGAVPPTVTTSAATLITDSTATLNGNLGAVGNGTVAGNIVTVRQFAHNRCTETTCAATLALPTITNRTIVVIVSSSGGSTTPTDDGANNYTGWNTLTDLSGRRLFQLDFAGVNEGPTLAALYGVTNPMQTVTAHSTGNPSGLFVAEAPKSIPLHATKTPIP